MTLDELKAYIDERFPNAVEGPPWPVCQTGDRYVVIAPKPQFQIVGPDKYETEEWALDAARRAFDEYAEGKEGTLYWRIRPEMLVKKRQRSDHFRVYMRLVISDKPVLYADARDYKALTQPVVVMPEVIDCAEEDTIDALEAKRWARLIDSGQFRAISLAFKAAVLRHPKLAGPLQAAANAIDMCEERHYGGTLAAERLEGVRRAS